MSSGTILLTEDDDALTLTAKNGAVESPHEAWITITEDSDTLLITAQIGAVSEGGAGSMNSAEPSDSMIGLGQSGDPSSYILGTFNATPPIPVMSASGGDGGIIAAAFPMPSLVAYGAGEIRASAPMPTISVVGELPASMSIVASFPVPRMSASGDVPPSMSISATAPTPSMVAYGGGEIRASAPMPIMSGSGFSEVVGSISAVAPVARMSAQAEQPEVGSFIAAFPMPVVAGSGEAAFVFPMLTMSASGINGPAVSFQTFAVNLRHKVDQAPQPVFVNEVTSYAGFANARQIIRHGDKHFVITDDAIYEHAGDTDCGQPIGWEMRTGFSDLGSRNRKQIRYMYVGGRLGGGFTGEIIPGDSDAQNNPNSNPRSQKPQNGRVLAGRGTRARYYGFGLSNSTGEPIDIDAIDIEFDVSARAK